MTRENLDVADLVKHASENLTRLSQYGEVIPTVLFKDSSLIKNLVLLAVMPRHEFPSLRFTHLVQSSDIVILRIPRFGYRKPESLW